MNKYMKSAAVLGIAVLGALCVLITPTIAEEMSVEALMKAHVKAMGGTEAMDKIKSIHRKGPASMDGAFGQMEGTIEKIVVIGKKAYSQTEFGVFVETSGWNGKTGWTENPMEGVQPITGDDLEFLESSAELSILTTVWHEYGNSALERADDVTYEGKTYHVLQIAGEEGLNFYLDPDTALLAGMSMPVDDPELGEGVLLITSEDYKEYEGVMLPTKMTIDIADSMIVIEMKYTEITINGDVDNSIFEKPGS